MNVEKNAAERPRILVADDQEDILLALDILLRNEGFDVFAVQSPAAVIIALRDQAPFDLILMDLSYTRNSQSVREGIDLLAQIERVDPYLAVVVMTAWGSIDLAVEAMHIGAANFIQKPWENRRLLQIVREQIARCRARRRQERLLAVEKKELEEAEALQRAFLPPELPVLDACEVAVRWQPKGRIGGDYYDVFRLDSRRLGFCVADASGKGLPAALLVSNLQAGLRSFAKDVENPAEVVTRLNRLLCTNQLINKFVTLFYGVIDTTRLTLTYSNAGHPPLLLRYHNGGGTALKETGGLVGFFPDWTYRQESIPLFRGDRLWLFTDGILEARDAAGNEYGSTRLEGLLTDVNTVPLGAAQERIWKDALDFCGGEFEDDATVLSFHVNGTPS